MGSPNYVACEDSERQLSITLPESTVYMSWWVDGDRTLWENKSPGKALKSSPVPSCCGIPTLYKDPICPTLMPLQALD